MIPNRELITRLFKSIPIPIYWHIKVLTETASSKPLPYRQMGPPLPRCNHWRMIILMGHITPLFKSIPIPIYWHIQAKITMVTLKPLQWPQTGPVLPRWRYWSMTRIAERTILWLRWIRTPMCWPMRVIAMTVTSKPLQCPRMDPLLPKWQFWSMTPIKPYIIL